jgi:aldose 1-epimerase
VDVGEVLGHTSLTLVGPGGALSATLIPSLGMVCSSLTFEREQLLELRGGAEAYAQRGSTFGIPLLHPWANRLGGWSYDAGSRHVELDPASPCVHRDGSTGLPMHGLLGASPYWTVTLSGPDADSARLCAELEFGAHPELLAAFPFPHRLELCTMVRAAQLSVRLTLTPTGDVAVPISFGFHPYLRLPGSDRRDWTIELPVRRRAVLDARGIPTGDLEQLTPGALSGPLRERTFDDCFDELEPAAFSLADARRRIAVEFLEGYVVAQVYAPPESNFVCFEPMTAPVDALRSGAGLRWAEPGAPFTADFAISVTEI